MESLGRIGYGEHTACSSGQSQRIDMKIKKLEIEGACLIQPEPIRDERGFFGRIFDVERFREHGLATSFPQWSISFNRAKGTLRGMHYQVEPHPETKLVRCTAGRIHDVIVDLRRDSATYGRWVATELSAENRRTLYVPAGCAHGFLTLEDDSEVGYFISTGYFAELQRGVRWDDPAFGIDWPIQPTVISDRDQQFEVVSL